MSRDPIEVRGSDRLARTLAAAADDLADLRAEHARIGATLAAAARTRAPRRTGRLVASIGVTPSPQKIELSAGTPYAAVINFGSRRKGIRPNPFLTGTVDKNPTIVPLYRDALDRALSKVRGI